MSSCDSDAGMETSAPALINAIVNNALFRSTHASNRIPPQIIHILHFFW